MNWPRRHRTFTLGAIAALALLGFSGGFLIQGWRRNAATSTHLAAATRELERLQCRVPSASPDSLKSARIEQERLARAIGEGRRHFAPYALPPALNNAHFKYLLTQTTRSLDGLGDAQGVRRPERFAYTFEQQRDRLSFSPGDLEPWAWQLRELDALCRILYASRVHALVSLRRASVSPNDDPRVVLPGVAPKTNLAARAVSTPYEVVFHGFTRELSNVLSGLIESPHGFLLRNVNVEIAPPPQTPPMPVPIHHPATLVAGPNTPRLLPPDRYRQKPTPAAAPQLLGNWPPDKTPRTVVDAQLLQFTLRVDAIRPLPD